jgi:hypothetical protein
VEAVGPGIVHPHAGSHFEGFRQRLADEGVTIQAVDAYPGGLPR